MPEAEERWGDGFCPNQAAINTWVSDCLEDCISRYPMDGIEIDHARYLPPISLPNLLTCTFTACASQASEAGENLAELTALLKNDLPAHQRLPVQQVMAALKDADDLLLALDALLPGQTASRWFRLRCRYISKAIQEHANRVRNAAGKPYLFGIDVFPPSIAILGGHNYADLDMLDYFTGGFGIIGWEKAGAAACAAWTDCMQQC